MSHAEGACDDLTRSVDDCSARRLANWLQPQWTQTIVVQLGAPLTPAQDKDR